MLDTFTAASYTEPDVAALGRYRPRPPTNRQWASPVDGSSAILLKNYSYSSEQADLSEILPIFWSKRRVFVHFLGEFGLILYGLLCSDEAVGVFQHNPAIAVLRTSDERWLLSS